jgi:hypothetical protein
MKNFLLSGFLFPTILAPCFVQQIETEIKKVYMKKMIWSTANLTIGFMMTKMTGFHIMELLAICSGNTVSDMGIACKQRMSNVIGVNVKFTVEYPKIAANDNMAYGVQQNTKTETRVST